MPTTWRALGRVGDERRGVARAPRPSRRGSRPSGRSATGGALEAAVVEDPLDLLVGEEERGQRRRVVGLVLAAVVEGDLQVERRRAPSGRDAAIALDPLDGARASTAASHRPPSEAKHFCGAK